MSGAHDKPTHAKGCALFTRALKCDCGFVDHEPFVQSLPADEIMRQVHKQMIDDVPRGTIYAEGVADGLQLAGLLTKEQRDLWMLAIKSCPGHHDGGGRVWCAFCGDLKGPT